MESKTFLILTTFYPPYHIGGDAIHAYQLSNELSKKGHEVHVVHLLDSYLIKRKNPRNGAYPNEDGTIVHTIKSPYGAFSLLNAYIFGKSNYIDKQVGNIIKTAKPDVLHHHNVAGFGPSALEYSAPKVLYTAHDYWAICPLGTLAKPTGAFCSNRSYCAYCLINSKRPLQLWRYTSLTKKVLSKIDLVISPSEFLKEVLERNGIMKKIVCIPNFVPIPEGDYEPIYTFNYFLFVGSLERHKGVLNLIEIFENIKNKTDHRLLLVGSGSLKSAIYEKIERNNSSDHIRLLGDVDNLTLQGLYAHADAVIIPSTWPENNPLVALEALASGKPIIVSDQGGLPEIACKIDAKLIFKTSDFKQLESILLHFDKSRYPMNSINKIYDNNFSINRYMENYSKLLG
jgi:glycosyltransferase involved in cell wall biosynthesis